MGNGGANARSIIDAARIVVMAMSLPDSPSKVEKGFKDLVHDGSRKRGVVAVSRLRDL
jgi:hypothetical protein